MDLRCDNKKFGELMDGAIVVKCSSRFCQAGDGVVVLHYFDPLNGTLINTRRFRDPVPATEGKEERYAARHDSAAVRSA